MLVLQYIYHKNAAALDAADDIYAAADTVGGMVDYVHGDNAAALDDAAAVHSIVVDGTVLAD